MSACFGIDLGTSAAKLTVLTDSGEARETASVPYPTAAPLHGYQEQATNDWWRACTEVLARAVADTGTSPAAIGLTGQMHSLVTLAADSEVIRPAILWSDTRSAKEAHDAAGLVDFEAITGNPILPAFTLAHLLWLRSNEGPVTPSGMAASWPAAWWHSSSIQRPRAAQVCTSRHSVGLGDLEHSTGGGGG